MQAYRLANGNLLIPKRAEADGVIGDGMVEVKADSEDGKAWLAWYESRGEEVPPAPEQGPPTGNSNPEGCNQHTGPGCRGVFDRAALSKEIGARSIHEIRDLQREMGLDMTGKKADLLRDMEARGTSALPGEGKSPAASAPPADALGRLAAAFHAHPGAKHNLVPLVDLKDASGLATPDLHAAVQHLRREGVAGLSAIEGRHGTTAREREAAVLEDGTHLGFLRVKEGQEKRFRGMVRNARPGLVRRLLARLFGR